MLYKYVLYSSVWPPSPAHGEALRGLRGDDGDGSSVVALLIGSLRMAFLFLEYAWCMLSV